MYSASAYYEIVEKILLENVLLKKFKPMKSYFLLSNCFNNGGILDYFSHTKSLKSGVYFILTDNLVTFQMLNV